MQNIDDADTATESTDESRGLRLLATGLGLFSILIMLPNLAGILASAGGCVLRASIPAVFVAAALAVCGLLLGSFGESRLAVRLNQLAIVFVLLAPVLLATVPIGMPNTDEAVAIGDLRSFVSAQATYAWSNGGYYEARLECLTTPTMCLRDYPEDAPPFLDAVITNQSERRGYVRMFVPGAWADASAEPPSNGRNDFGESETSLASYALIAVPASESGGTRSFCVDSTGHICYTPRGRYPVATNGQCGQCETLE